MTPDMINNKAILPQNLKLLLKILKQILIILINVSLLNLYIFIGGINMFKILIIILINSV